MNDQERWDEKYHKAGCKPVAECDPFVLGALNELGPGQGQRALDLACGTGRHGLELARRACQVEAWDVSGVGLRQLSLSAEQANLNIQCRRVDLTLPLPTVGEAFDLIILVSYLDRELLPRLGSLLRPGGHLVYVTFTTDREGSHPSDRHCLTPGELAQGLPGLDTKLHRELNGRAGYWGIKPKP
jgi:tellurite methyltransferase